MAGANDHMARSPEEITPWARALVLLGMMTILIPPAINLWLSVFPSRMGGPHDGQGPFAEFPVLDMEVIQDQGFNPALLNWIGNIEQKLDEGSPTTSFYQDIYNYLALRVFQEGNRRVEVGANDWLLLRENLDALTGRSPLEPTPIGVAQPVPEGEYVNPVDAIIDFQEQLKERGITLFLVSIPSKAMIYPEALGVRLQEPLAIQYPHAEAVYAPLREAGVRVIDLLPIFEKTAAERDELLYLRHDTHWSPAGMRLSAREISRELRTLPGYSEISKSAPPLQTKLQRASIDGEGDLLRMLGVGGGSSEYLAVELVQVINTKTGNFVRGDRESPVVMLADSHGVIYSLPVEGQVMWGEGAGLAETLMHELGFKIHVIAENAGAATGVRRTLAAENPALDGVKAIIWVISSRFLFLPETGQRAQFDQWDYVEFAPSSGDDRPADRSIQLPAKLSVRATITDAGEIPQERNQPYTEALRQIVLRVEETQEAEGSFVEKGDTIVVFQLVMENGEFLPGADLRIGDRVKWELTPWEEQPPQVQSFQKLRPRQGAPVVDEEGERVPWMYVQGWSD